MTVTAETLRWAVNVSKWEPTKHQWQIALDCLPHDAQERCLRYRQRDDQKRAVVSQLLQLACIHQIIGQEWIRIDIRRTKGNKPFYAGGHERKHAPNFNYNVSHEGDYVVLACEGHCITGVDVAAPQQIRRRSGKTLLESLHIMKSQLTDSEWSLVQSLSDDESAMESTFQAIWSCKEAFIKARGDGLAFEPLSRIEVQIPPNPKPKHCTCSCYCCFCPNTTSMTHPQQQQQRRQQQLEWLANSSRQPVQRLQLVVDGVLQRRWRVFVQQMPNRHWVAVVRGPPEAVVDADGVFKATLMQANMSDKELQVHLDARSPPFDMLQVEDVLPEFAQELYIDVQSDV